MKAVLEYFDFKKTMLANLPTDYDMGGDVENDAEMEAFINGMETWARESSPTITGSIADGKIVIKIGEQEVLYALRDDHAEMRDEFSAAENDDDETADIPLGYWYLDFKASVFDS